jgi:hypothetical protein
MAPDLPRRPEASLYAAPKITDADIQSVPAWEVLGANGAGYGGFGVNQDVVDDLVNRPLQRPEERGRVVELVQHEIADRVDRPKDVIPRRDPPERKKPSRLVEADPLLVRNAKLFMQVHASQIGQRVWISSQMDSPAFINPSTRPRTQEGDRGDIHERATGHADDQLRPVAAQDVSFSKRGG